MGINRNNQGVIHFFWELLHLMQGQPPFSAKIHLKAQNDIP
jgi:hypothetical protein